MKPPQTRRQRAAYLAQEGHLVANRQVRADFAFLAALATDEAIPIEAVHDWRTALRRAVVETQREQLLVHLPQVYEGCLMRQSLGIAHPVAAEAAAWLTEHQEWLRKRPLDGRELLGKPRTFDFYD